MSENASEPLMESFSPEEADKIDDPVKRQLAQEVLRFTDMAGQLVHGHIQISQHVGVNPILGANARMTGLANAMGKALAVYATIVEADDERVKQLHGALCEAARLSCEAELVDLRPKFAEQIARAAPPAEKRH